MTYVLVSLLRMLAVLLPPPRHPSNKKSLQLPRLLRRERENDKVSRLERMCASSFDQSDGEIAKALSKCAAHSSSVRIAIVLQR